MDDSEEQDRMSAIHQSRLREVQARRSLPVGDPIWQLFRNAYKLKRRIFGHEY